MAKDEINEALDSLESKKKICSSCGKEILRGQFYIRDIITNELFCSECDDGQPPIKGDNLFSID
ncbi:MAG: hypothetical protein BAJALOKI1v1_2010007 [Promethearchaeota archaeon]|nr:MAG: hypothetical protein BAJALOKI1v1_2010007 [Candidatus Lokiarchaeota archaeon]